MHCQVAERHWNAHAFVNIAVWLRLAEGGKDSTAAAAPRIAEARVAFGYTAAEKGATLTLALSHKARCPGWLRSTMVAVCGSVIAMSLEAAGLLEPPGGEVACCNHSACHDMQLTYRCAPQAPSRGGRSAARRLWRRRWRAPRHRSPRWRTR